MSRPLNPSQLGLQQALRAKIEQPSMPPSGTPQIFWATIVSRTAGPPSTLDVTMSTGDVVTGLRHDTSVTTFTAGTLVWGWSVNNDYFVAGVRQP